MLSDDDYQALAEFRFQVRKFLAFAEHNARERNLSAQQHQVLLVIRGTPARRIGVQKLGERLLIKKHSASELASRLKANGLVTRTTDPADGRRVMLRLTPAAETILSELTDIHRAEIARIRPELGRLLSLMDREDDCDESTSGLTVETL